jgi:ADP-heptose:LPS heptosyltransferase
MKRILIIRFSAIGDIILTTPVVRALRSKYSGADIRFVTKPQFAQLIEPNLNLNGVFVLKSGIKDLAKELKEFKPDLVVDLHHNLRTRILRVLIGGKWLSFNKLNVEKWLAVNLKMNRLPDTHIVDRYLETVRTLEIDADGKSLDFFFPKDIQFPKIPAEFDNGFVAVVIGAKFKTKQLPESKLVELCDGLKKPIILIGGQEDKVLAEAITAKTGAILHNGCGEYSIAQSAWILKQANAVITHDTGMMHIATAFNKKVVSVWGNTIPEFGMSPYFKEGSYLSEVSDLNCRPCSKIGYAKCPKGHFKCMEDQDIDKIISKTHQFLAS